MLTFARRLAQSVRSIGSRSATRSGSGQRHISTIAASHSDYEVQRAFLEAQNKESGGNKTFVPLDDPFENELPPQQGPFDVVGHPSQVNQMMDDAQKKQQLKAMLDRHMALGGLSAVRLFTCHAADKGHADKALAQRFADEFDLDTLASSDAVGISADGTHDVTEFQRFKSKKKTKPQDEM